MSKVIDAPESMDLEGAALLAGRINAYWAERGYQVNARIEPFRGGRDFPLLYAVRSDMVDGYPCAWGTSR